MVAASLQHRKNPVICRILVRWIKLCKRPSSLHLMLLLLSLSYRQRDNSSRWNRAHFNARIQLISLLQRLWKWFLWNILKQRHIDENRSNSRNFSMGRLTYIGNYILPLFYAVTKDNINSDYRIATKEILLSCSGAFSVSCWATFYCCCGVAMIWALEKKTKNNNNNNYNRTINSPQILFSALYLHCKQLLPLVLWAAHIFIACFSYLRLYRSLRPHFP